MSANNDMELLAKQLEESQRRIDLIRIVTLELNAISSLPDKLNNILKILHDQFGINHSMMVLPNRLQQSLLIKACYGYGDRQANDSIDVSAGIIGLAANSKRPINITGLRRKKLYMRTASAATTEDMQPGPGLENPESQIAIPLIVNDELVAVLMAESYNTSVFSREDENFLITLSQSIAVSIQNAMLFDNMEELIAERTAALKKSNQTKDQLFSIISHDLRGPVTSFHNISKLINHYNKQGEKEKVNTLFTRIDRSVSRLNHLLDNLLNWALAHRDEISCQVTQIEMSELLSDVTAVYEEQLLAKGLRLIINGPEPTYVAGDYNTLSAVFRNILSNAIKYSPRDGTIQFDIKIQEDVVVVTCSDTGAGISSERLAALFEFKENRSTVGTENEKGTGLGLLVAKEFVQLNRGEIQVFSEPGKGTTVEVKLIRFGI